jgi:hypothetical protein
VIDIATLRAAGLTDQQILRVLEAEQNERKAARREQNRINQQKHRKNKQSIADRQHVSADGADGADVPSQVSQVSPQREISNPSSFPSSPSCSLRSHSGGQPSATRPFDEFWKVYPKREGSNPKAPAERKFVAACKSGTDPNAIIGGARVYAKQLGEKGQIGTPYVMQALTWLNRRCWEDYGGAPADLSNPYLDPKHPQFEDYKHGWRPGMPTSAEMRNGKGNTGKPVASMVPGCNGVRAAEPELVFGPERERAGQRLAGLFREAGLDPNDRSESRKGIHDAD